MRRVSPIDYRAVRRGLCAAIAACTGLGQNHILLANPEVRGAPLPAYPFVLFALSGAGRTLAQDSMAYSPATEQFEQYGPRELTVNFDCYGATHEEAWDLAACLQMGLDGPDGNDALAIGSLSLWNMGEAFDLSSLEETGFEGRARLTCRFGVPARRSLSLLNIETVPLQGTVADEAGEIALVEDATVTLETSA